MSIEKMIPISKNGGLEPHLTYCPVCGDDSDSITVGVLYKYVSDFDNTTIVHADRNSRKKVEKEYTLPSGEWVHVEEHERVPDSQPCDKCIKEHTKTLEAMKEEVEQGGVYFKCLECGTMGAIPKDTEAAKIIRKESGVKIPDPVGIEFEHCGKHKKAH